MTLQIYVLLFIPQNFIAIILVLFQFIGKPLFVYFIIKIIAILFVSYIYKVYICCIRNKQLNI